MAFDIKKHKDQLLFAPLGGSGEIGLNMNMYHLNGKWLMVDFGAGFAEDFLPGVDMILPDIRFIEEHKPDIVGLVLTHAHEDHLGAITYLWEYFDCPIYATPFTAAFLKEKIADSDLRKKPKIIEVKPNSTFQVGEFGIEMVQITHSVPEMNAVMIRTPYGNIFHSGDWKLDHSPMIGEATDQERIKRYGDEGILAYVGDSTNVFSPGWSGSEGDLRESLISLIADCKQMVLVTTFASNVARIESIVRAAEACGRRVVLAGRSLWRIARAAQQSGYLTDMKHPFMDELHVDDVPRDKLLIIATGCQGEPMAAVNKIVTATHRSIRIKPGDTVLFSSKIIPGNEKRILRLFNQFVKLGAEILTEKNAFVHVSGHPNRDELQRMYELARPRIAIPVHGEEAHMHEHALLAKSWGVPHVIQVTNGDVIKLAPGEPQKISRIESGILAIDGKLLLPPDSHIMSMRRKMRREGVIILVLVIEHGELIIAPSILTPGVLDPQVDRELIRAMEEEVEEALEQSRASSKKGRPGERQEQVARAAIRRIIRSEIGKNPPIEVIIRDVTPVQQAKHRR